MHHVLSPADTLSLTCRTIPTNHFLTTLVIDSWPNGRSDKLQGSRSLPASHSVTARLSVRPLISNLPLLLLASQINIEAAGSLPELGSPLKSLEYRFTSSSVFQPWEPSGNLHVWEPESSRNGSRKYWLWFKLEVLFPLISHFSSLSCFFASPQSYPPLLGRCDGPVPSRRSITSYYLIFQT